ncbi:MAG TPA: TM2 domain-containing protein, partial [Opitutales bacterium]|nr:TM2 domain-containing protein [Opitutales bacterium]
MSKTDEGSAVTSADQEGKRAMPWRRCLSWDRGPFHFRPLLIIAACALWLVAGLDGSASALGVVQNMDLDKVLRFIAVVCVACSFNLSLRVVRELHIVLTVLVCLPLSLIGAFFFVALMFAGGFSLIFASALQIMDPGFLPFTLDTVSAVLSPVALLGVFAAGAATVWMLAYYFVFVPYSMRSDHLRKRYDTTLILLLNAGVFGAHHFYVKNYLRGAVYLGTLGLFGVGVVYDLIRFASGKLRDAEGRPVMAPELRSSPRVPTAASREGAQDGEVKERTTHTKGTSPESARSALIVVSIFFCLIGVLHFLDIGWSFWLALPVGIVAGLVAVAALVVFSLTLTSERRRTLRSLPGSLRLMFVLWYRKFEGRDLAAARKASGCEGSVTRKDAVMLWTDCEDLKLEPCLATMERTSEIMQSRLDGKLLADGSLRLFVFLHIDAMWRYAPTGKRFGLPEDYVGFYTRPFQPRIVVLSGLADLFPLDFHNYLAHEYVHYLHLRAGWTSLPLWIVEGLATWIASEVRPPPPSLILGRRRLWTYLESSRSLLAGGELAQIGPLFGDRRLADQSVRSRYLREMALYAQSQCLFDWLYTQRRERLIEATLNPAGALVAAPGQFQEHFEISPDEAMANAMEARRVALEEPVIEDHQAKALRERSAHKLYQVLSDPAATAASQRMALRLLPSIAFDLDVKPL